MDMDYGHDVTVEDLDEDAVWWWRLFWMRLRYCVVVEVLDEDACMWWWRFLMRMRCGGGGCF